MIRPAVSDFGPCVALVLNSHSRRKIIWSSSCYLSSPWLGLYSVPSQSKHSKHCGWDGFQRENEALLQKKKKRKQRGLTDQNHTPPLQFLNGALWNIDRLTA